MGKTMTWIKEHKGEIIFYATTGAIIVAGVVGINKLIGKSNDLSAQLERSIAESGGGVPEAILNTVEITESWRDGKFTEMIVNDFTAKDMGEMGKDLMEHFPEIKEDTVLSAIMNTTTLTKSV